MPKYRKKYSKKSKWRQQKIAVGTIQKIAKKIAKNLDDKQNQSTMLTHTKIHMADGVTWATYLQLPPPTDWRPIIAGSLENKIISDVSGRIQTLANAHYQSTVTEPYKIPVWVKGVQARFAIQNRSSASTRVEAQLIFCPNLNYDTDDAVDFLRPSVYYLYKRGTGNLIYDGMGKKALTNASSSGSGPIKYIILDRKVVNIPGARYQHQESGSSLVIPYYKTTRLTLTKWFHNERKHNCYIKNSAVVETNYGLIDGNYFFMIWSDLPNGESLHYVCATTMRLRPGSTTKNIGG